MPRAKGTKNKRTLASIREAKKACRHHKIEPLERLAFLAANAKDEKVRLSATVQLVAYIHGKPQERVEYSGGLTYYDAVAKARARVLAFEQRPPADKPAAAPPAETPAVPSFAEWKTENGLDPTPQQPAAPESEDPAPGQLKRIVMQ